MASDETSESFISHEQDIILISDDSDSNSESAVIENLKPVRTTSILVPISNESKLWWNNLKEDVPGEQQCKIKDCKFAPLGHRAHPLFQRNYCGQEMKLIIQYLNYYDVIHSGKGFCVWEDMHSRGYMRHRTVQSLNNNFKKILLRDIEVFQLPQSLEDKFLELRHISASDRKDY
ncbi:PREDICTED: uncharacterized protein LOC105360436 [Ceratosolen solmsi marchali]|uniref:Uncharacterized protein LOC105360436 n=1 Tax=Ceratosolen solmsi marchali TaxID=326594 RepID=A0AAJ6VNP4_9HYME|nr:PREDICTED: uncharacterized protein LOC105360436 [Ceratosolen solmsi marchali]